MRVLLVIPLALLFSSGVLQASAQQCGKDAGGAVCPGGLCCSEWGYCGDSSTYCCKGCQSQCNCNVPPPPPYVPPPPPPPPSPPPPPRPPTPPGQGIGDIVTEDLFEEFLLHRGTPPCVGAFYTYGAFLDAAASFKEFGMTGNLETRKREIAAFLAQTSHETTGGWDGAPDGRYSWGYCWIREGMTTDPSILGDYCQPNEQWPCAPGKKYYGRGPIQLSYNFNYGQAAEDLDYDLLANPDILEQDPYLSFESAFWFWMKPQPPKPSCHDVMVGKWTPTPEEINKGWLPGLGLTTNIINGGVECGGPNINEQVADRIGYYLRYCELFGVDPGPNLNCSNMQQFIGINIPGQTKAALQYDDEA